MTDASQLDEISVAEYLAAHPDFFTQHSGLLASMVVPAQNGSGTISLVERQQQAQREKIRQLETNYANLLVIGNQNDALADKLHQFTLRLIAADHDQLSQIIIQSLQQDFNIEHASIVHPAQQAESAVELQQWIAQLSEPYCGNQPAQPIRQALPESYQSFACIPLQIGQDSALLVLASQHQDRFYAGMGTMFLTRIGELASAVFSKSIQA
jgi:uncharacterized protein YigA (DUF484 family)